jgi:hypothetical protein
MVAVAQCTAPGTPRPGSESTCPQARLGIPSQSDGLDPHLRRLQLEEPAMAPHQGHPSGASAPVSQLLLVPQQPHPSDASHPAAVSPALAALVPGPRPPPAREVPHLHKHQTSNKQRYQCLYIKTYALEYQQHTINHQNITTSHTSVIKCLPRRQYHIGVPPEVHPRIRKP